MALRGKIVDFIRLHKADDANQRGRIGKIAVVKRNRVLRDQVVDPCCIGNGRTSCDAVYLIALFKQKLRKIGTVLSRNTGDKRFFHFVSSTFFVFGILLSEIIAYFKTSFKG